ncbi:hypothetical protein GCM10010954_31810 [Halobacillus andaensis]|uniref:Uncharacterized protein n=1 Tax=Halobacillus andaensis TaxID=1176239 RepID=A0A917B7N9_HALAA|nr:hypothetical protein [Halobacillus andaensis]MBP2005287.1 hypothetical protein [Halobacillus andaensis]GGF30306.1 hypothetical protein GCM10010954_31810 [Halobacillus andaensis]
MRKWIVSLLLVLGFMISLSAESSSEAKKDPGNGGIGAVVSVQSHDPGDGGIGK